MREMGNRALLIRCNRSVSNRRNRGGVDRLLVRKRESRATVMSGMRAMFTGLNRRRALRSVTFVAFELLLTTLSIVACAGCSGGLNKSAVKGTVKFKKGAVIEQGMIELWHLTATHDLEAVW